ncbi:hypothetical protein CI1B_46730 [Bradyrhizobium ivorense]|uniref:Uncharacterized protein n=1 Tax=Bradyrhizobium ivorense TaxID=2511166 RepID=A0A508TEW0_9BRAD|nr:hypothetical protein CI1B_46730 [Bradyrhizobium ivorense]
MSGWCRRSRSGCRDASLAAALKRAAAAHGEHEKRTGGHDANWPDWYAAYIAGEQSGQKLPD